ncbi:MAG: sulfotransferase family protein [Rhodospirillaceae bacterium]|nr:MAG: sulfotransferase family protein [Rhodospirillaceae bacterium]
MPHMYECMDVVQPGAIQASTITVVSGLPRSGTSMMMRMCKEGGLDLFADFIRKKDQRNPHGYFEFEKVKEQDSYSSWIKDASGKTIKVISRLLPQLPSSHFYKIIFLQRSLCEVLRSQAEMAAHESGEEWGKGDLEQLEKMYQLHLSETFAWLKDRPNMDVLVVPYEGVLSNPLGEAKRISTFLGSELDVTSMTLAVDESLNHAPSKKG